MAQRKDAEMSRAPSTHRFIATLISGALFSKVLGFIREILMAQVIGASLVADGFRGAITAVILPLAFLQNESVPAIMIPMHREAQERGDAPKHLAALTIALTSIAMALMLAVQALGTWWVGAIVGGFSQAGQQLTLEFVRIMALGMPASVLINCLAAAEIALGRTRLTNVRASLLNIAVLCGIAVLALTGYVHALAWSFAIAFNALAIWALWSMWRERIIRFEGVNVALVLEVGIDFLHRLRPLLALPLAEQGNIWVERLLASRLATGAVASLDYARTLTESALLLVSQPVGLAVLSGHPEKDARAQIDTLVRPVLALALPASMFLVVFAPEVVRLVFHRGAFSEEGVVLTSQALRGIAVGLWAATLAWILIRILNTAGRNALAAAIIVAAYGANVAVNLVTAHMPAAHTMGTLLLGLGEAVRSIVLLAAIVLVLEERRKLLFIILLAMIPAALMGLLGWEIRSMFTGTLDRLLVGGLACAACVALASALLMPTTYALGLARVRGWMSGGGPS